MDSHRRALIVANGRYDHEGLRHLRSPEADAAALADVLADPQIGHFEVTVVRDEPNHEVQEQIEELFSSGNADDLLLLHLSCHGLKSDSGELFFAVRNTRPDRLLATAVPADFVQRCIRGSRSRSVVLLLDCCYGGAYGSGVAVRSSGEANVMDNFPQQKLGAGRGRAVITASSAIEYAFEGEVLADEKELRPSIFTSALVTGLKTGEADRDEDGLVSLNELYDYVFDKVREKNPHQTPRRDIEMAGELYLAHSRRKRIKPSPIPPDLESAMHDSNMYSRIGAIGELRARMLGDNLPAAVGAHAALSEMAATDIAHVAELAVAACEEACIHADCSEVHFGQVEAGAPPPHRTVRLLGPPIARACKVDVSDDRLQATVEDPDVDLTIDTGPTGALHGILTFTGPTGESVVSVDAEVVSPRPEPPRPEAPRPEPPRPEPPRPEPPRPEPPRLEPPRPEPPRLEPPRPEAPRPEAPRPEAPRGWRTGWVWGLLLVADLVLLGVYPGLGMLALVLLLVGYMVEQLRRRRLREPPRVPAPAEATGRPRADLTPWLPPASKRPLAADPDRSDEAVPTVRLVALGVAGSGKTVLLSSMFHTLNVPMPGRSFFLETDAAHRVYLSRVFDEVSDTEEPWPRGTRTGESRELDFDCVSFREGVKNRICRISYLDYAGELLEREPEAGETALQELEQRVRAAHGLLGILDGFRVLQYLRDEPAGRRYFRSSIQPLIGMMAAATSPIHFALTKWDLVHGFGEPSGADDAARLALVREALLENTQLRALVETHGYGSRAVRLFPVSAVGPDFALVDSSGHVVKRRDGRVRPSRVELLLTAVLPDLFGYVDNALAPGLQAAVAAAARNRTGLTAMDPERALAGFVPSADGFALGRNLQEAIGPHGDSLMGMFLDWKGLTLGGSLQGADAMTLEAARSRVVAEFHDSLSGVEAELPASRLNARDPGD